MFGLTPEEKALFKKLSTPIKIQDFLDSLPFNHEEIKEGYISPREVLKHKKAHCFEGALLACAILWYHGEEPLLLDLKSVDPDIDHVVALYKTNGHWGAISKTNHYCLRFRDPIYKNIRELALSYFHEYFLNKNGVKTLKSYSKPFNLKKYDTSWVTTEEDLEFLVEAIDESPHTNIVPAKNKKSIKKATRIERKAGEIVEWAKKG